jgi:CxxC motif-containing protein (DUF1111 family)
MRRLTVLSASAWLVAAAWALVPLNVSSQSGATEAPAGFDNLSNGLVDADTHEADLDVFAEQELVEDGLGPVYNAQSCGECHQNPVTGAGSQITEQRAGRLVGGVFVDHPGDSLIHSRATNADVQERIQENNPVRTLRSSLNTLGDGFVEAIANDTLIGIASAQPAAMRGQVVFVPVLEADGSTRVGRFGHKAQHASLVSFSADAYLNEMGITTPFLPEENSSNGRYVGFGSRYDPVEDPEDDGDDVEIFARFMRATKAPPRDTVLAATQEARVGASVFNAIGCNICHTPTIVTAPAGTRINGGAFTVPAALGNKIIHPFGDFLLHNIGTGDGIVQNGGPSTRNKIRTAPLWGLRTRNRLMHDGLALTMNEAILRHGGEAATTRLLFGSLPGSLKGALITFLESL